MFSHQGDVLAAPMTSAPHMCLWSQQAGDVGQVHAQVPFSHPDAVYMPISRVASDCGASETKITRLARLATMGEAKGDQPMLLAGETAATQGNKH